MTDEQLQEIKTRRFGIDADIDRLLWTDKYATFIAAAPADIDALIAEVERLRAAIRCASTLDELTRLVGPTGAENEAARQRIAAMDALFATHGNNASAWPDAARHRLERITVEQDTFEARYA